MSQPFLTPEDLGINLEEDSPDFTADDASSAIETQNQDDLIQKIKEALHGTTEPSCCTLRRRSGILYTVLTIGVGIRVIFKLPQESNVKSL